MAFCVGWCDESHAINGDKFVDGGKFVPIEREKVAFFFDVDSFDCEL